MCVCVCVRRVSRLVSPTWLPSSVLLPFQLLIISSNRFTDDPPNDCSHRLGSSLSTPLVDCPSPRLTIRDSAGTENNFRAAKAFFSPTKSCASRGLEGAETLDSSPLLLSRQENLPSRISQSPRRTPLGWDGGSLTPSTRKSDSVGLLPFLPPTDISGFSHRLLLGTERVLPPHLFFSGGLCVPVVYQAKQPFRGTPEEQDQYATWRPKLQEGC